MAQNMPDRLTVSLQEHQYIHSSVSTTELDGQASPAVDYNRMVPSPPLHLGHLLHCSSHTTEVGTAAVRGTVIYVELLHLLNITRLWRQRSKHWNYSKQGSTITTCLTYLSVCDRESPKDTAFLRLLPQYLHCELSISLCATDRA